MISAQVGCMRQVLGPGALGRPRGIGWRGRCEGGSGWGIHVIPWLIDVNVWQNPLQCCEVISLQLKKKKKKSRWSVLLATSVWDHFYWKMRDSIFTNSLRTYISSQQSEIQIDLYLLGYKKYYLKWRNLFQGIWQDRCSLPITPQNKFYVCQ